MQEDLLGSMKEEMLMWRGLIKDELIRQVKLQTPKGGIPAWRQIQALDNIDPYEMIKIHREFGDEATEELIGSIEKLRADGRRTK